METVGTALTVLEVMISEVAQSSPVSQVPLRRVSALTGCFLHHQRIETEIVRSVTISVPWWCKWKNESLGEATRQKAVKRKVQIFSC